MVVPDCTSKFANLVSTARAYTKVTRGYADVCQAWKVFGESFFRIFQDARSRKLSVIVGTNYSLEGLANAVSRRWWRGSRCFYSLRLWLGPSLGLSFGPTTPSRLKTLRFALSRWNNRQTRLYDHPSRSKTSKNLLSLGWWEFSSVDEIIPTYRHLPTLHS